MGNDWALFRVLIGTRMTGKSYSVTERICKIRKKYGDNCKCYWMRLAESSTKALLSNKARNLVDPDLVRKYNLELSTKGSVVKNHGKDFIEVYPLCSMGKLKGQAFFDKDFRGRYVIVLDEFQTEIGEKRTSFDILYNFIGMLENIGRTTKTNIEVWILGNNLQEASPILKAFNFIPQKPGRYYLHKKRCIMDYLPVTEEYLEDRKGSMASLLGGDDMSNFTNEIEKEMSLVDKSRLIRPTSIIMFTKDRSDWYTVWDGQDGNKIIRRWKGETVGKYISMRRYMSKFFD